MSQALRNYSKSKRDLFNVKGSMSHWRCPKKKNANQANRRRKLKKSKNKIYANKKDQAPYFNYGDKELGGSTTRLERAMGSIISFEPIVSKKKKSAPVAPPE
jgi:hypothetical protein